MELKVDYHIHTAFSDGLYRPAEIVRRYKGMGYDVIAITDHDGIGGIEEAMAAGEALGLRVVPGIELSTRHVTARGGECELHILGYGINTGDSRLQEVCERLRDYRRERNSEMLAMLADKGWALDRADLDPKPGAYIGKPDIVRALRRKGCKAEDPFALLEGPGKKMITSAEAIDVIRGAGGTAVLAHPMKIKALGPRTEGFFDRLGALLAELRGFGLRGLECFHPSASREDSLRLIEIADSLNMHVTRGSDFHGDEEGK